MIPYGKQDITPEDVEQVVKVLTSDFITQGDTVPAFEQALADYCGVRFGVAVNSGTSALHIACLALGVGKGDLVWTSPVTFVASANCALYCGADIDFVDIDPVTFNMSPHALGEKLKQAKSRGRLPKVVIPVHMCGQSCDMEKIGKLAEQYGFAVIEDACHAVGARYQQQQVGCCHYSDITVFSFHPVKIITTAEGGMAMTNNRDLAEKMALLRAHGITREADRMIGDSHGDWYYQQVGLGFNYRLTDIQAALGLSQLKRLDGYVQTRQRIAANYDQLLSDLPLDLPVCHPESYSSFHLYVIRLHLENIREVKKNIFSGLRDFGVGVNIHYIPVHTQPYFQELGFQNGDFPEAEKYYARALSLPVFPTLTGEQQQHVSESLHNIIGK